MNKFQGASPQSAVTRGVNPGPSPSGGPLGHGEGGPGVCTSDLISAYEVVITDLTGFVAYLRTVKATDKAQAFADLETLLVTQAAVEFLGDVVRELRGEVVL